MDSCSSAKNDDPKNVCFGDDASVDIVNPKTIVFQKFKDVRLLVIILPILLTNYLHVWCTNANETKSASTQKRTHRQRVLH